MPPNRDIKSDGCDNLGASFTSDETDQIEQFTGSNAFILVTKNEEKSKSVKHWFQKKIKNACSQKMLHRRIPILEWLPKYNSTSAISDLIAGITMGLTVIPQALAYSSIVGVPPEYGLYGSFLGCFIYIIFGSCKDSSIGPTATLALLSSEAVKGKGLEHVVLLCFLTGVVQILMGFFRLGFLIDFISGPVSSGFTSAAALIIVTSQMPDMLGVKASGTSFIDTWTNIINKYNIISVWDASLGVTCLAILLITRIIGKMKFGNPNKAPLNTFQIYANTVLWLISISRSSILVIGCSFLAYHYCQAGKPPFAVTGHVPSGMPTLQLPPFSANASNGTEHDNFLQMVTNLGSGILVVPLLGLLEDIAVCKAFANGKAVDATQEFLAIGFANIANSFVQAFPVTGALARSAVNNASGVRTTMGGLYTGLLVIASLLFFTPYFYYIPKATLAAIIIAAAIFMVEVKVVKPMWRVKKTDLVPGLSTFIGCLVLPLQYGILIGMGINVLFILYHAARPKISLEEVTSPKGVNYLLLTPDRCLIFPSVHYVKNLVTKYSVKQRIPVVIDCSHIYGADYTAATVIKALTQDFLDRKEPLFFFNLKASISSLIDGLSPKGFYAFYNREVFDELLQKWREETQNIV